MPTQPPQNKESKGSTAAACALAMMRIINASRFERSDIADYLGLTVSAVERRMRGETSFTLDEAVMICRLLDIPISDAMKLGGMTDEEFSNAWIYQWRRQNFAKHVAHLEADKGITRAKIAEICGRSEAWISKVLNGKSQLNAKSARLSEQRLELPEGWFDRKPMTPPKAVQIDQNLVAKTSNQLAAAIKTTGLEIDTDIINPYLTAVVQLYNARIATREGYDPEQDAAQFQAVFDQLTLQLKMKDGLWKY
ncbi:helix-turn-helix domain-containing protein [Marinomonas atlantica]|uniref:helix-turn-helix domain-containing protein n=1 Tax=Marinomonas atlantica TaxID=1806668 RepID=UPI00082FEBB6|nr:helix-turn-helix domain-containing protein [Marinomonas atlantica]